MMLPSYTKVLRLGHRHTVPVLDGRDVYIQEKIDGSQFSFGVLEGRLQMRSKGKALAANRSAGGLFGPAVAWCRANWENLEDGVIYRAEAVCRPRHNKMAYERAPLSGFVLWGLEGYSLSHGDLSERADWLADEADRLGVDYCRWLHSGPPGGERADERLDWYSAFLEAQHARGGLLGGGVEGIVIKPMKPVVVPATDGKPLAAKLVRPEFEESMATPRRKKQGSSLVAQEIGGRFAVEARWEKALQRAREDGWYTGEMRDIGRLLKSLNVDLEEEWGEQIRDMLWEALRKDVLRASTEGFVDWYKGLLERQALGETDQD